MDNNISSNTKEVLTGDVHEKITKFIYENNLKGFDAIVIDSTSKRYSMCGIRVGCLVSKNKEVINTAMKFAQARLSPPTFGQIAGEAALNTPQSYFDQVSAEYLSRRNLLIEGLNQIQGIVFPKPKGAFYTIAQLPIDDADKFCRWLLEEFDLNGETIMLAPAAGFYSTPNKGINQVRIAYVLNKKSLQRSIDILESALKVYPGRIL